MSFTGAPARSRWSDVYLSTSIQLFGSLGASLVMVTLLIGLQQRNASGWQVAALIIAEALPIVALGKVMGRLADRVDSRLLLMMAGFGQMASCQILVWAATADDGYPWLVGGGVALATATAVAGPTRTALIPAMVTVDDLPRAIALGQSTSSIGMMAGPALAGLLVGATDVRLTLQVTSFVFIATVIAGALIKTRRGRGTATSKVEDRLLGEPTGWKLSQDRMFWIVVWGMALVVGAVSAVNVVAVFYLLGTLQSGQAMFGVVKATWTTGMLIGVWVVARLIRPLTTDATLVRWIFISLAALSAMIFLAGTAQAALWVVPCWLVGGALNGLENVALGTLMGRRTPAQARGRAAAAMQSRIMGGAMAGFVAGGLLLEVVSPRGMFLGAGVLGILAVLVVTPVVLRLLRKDRLTDYEPAPPSPGGSHSVPQLPTPLLGPDAVGRADRR